MKSALKVLALIPARSGSKGIPHKNIRPFAGKPLIAHSIEQALACAQVNRVLVSTDSADYAMLARKYGAETPFIRPEEFARDASTDLEVFRHALNWLHEEENYAPDLVVHLRPTHPNRTPQQIGEAVDLLAAHSEWDSVRSVAPAPETPYKMWFQENDGTLRPVIPTDIPEAHSTPRQSLPPTFLQNACVDVVRPRTILELNSMAGRRIGAYVMEQLHDIDTPEQFAAAATAFTGTQLPAGRTFVVDIDGVICTISPQNDYRLAQPHADVIARINRLHDAGHRIILFTARGYVTGQDWAEHTRVQLAGWGVRYHELRFGKPAADFYVDDKALPVEFFSRF